MNTTESETKKEQFWRKVKMVYLRHNRWDSASLRKVVDDLSHLTRMSEKHIVAELAELYFERKIWLEPSAVGEGVLITSPMTGLPTVYGYMHIPKEALDE